MIFLAMANYPSDSFVQSFLAGWAIKALVSCYGGAGVFQKGKPLMFGLIAGEMIGGLVPMVVSWICTDQQLPPVHNVSTCG